jgi:putative endonuclease
MKEVKKAKSRNTDETEFDSDKQEGSQPEPKFWRQKIALAGETAAADLYKRQGYEILARNWRSGHHVEIDLICRNDSGLLIFVEVKTRCKEPGEYGFINYGFESINGLKQKKIQHGAACYMAQLGLAEARGRIDVVVVEYDSTKITGGQLPEPVVTQVEQAF